jgi:hypothetical protein
VSAAENGHTEPEAKDDQEEGPADEEATGQAVLDSDVELLDEIQTTWWYDDGDNVLDPGGTVEGQSADVMIVFDRSGSMTNQANKFQNAKDGAKALVDALGPNANVGLVSFADTATVDEPLGTAGSTVKSTIDGLGASGSTNINDAIQDAASQLSGGSGDEKYMVLLSNGGANVGGDPRPAANSFKSNADSTLIGIAYGTGANEGLIEDLSSPPKNNNGSVDAGDANAFFGSISTIQDVFDDIGAIIAAPGEEVIFRGSLRDSLTALSSGNGIPLDGDLETSFDEINGAEDADARECFVASNDYYIGFAWYLPVDHANEIQGDSVSFDLGFYTEQCRHNDGIGNRPANS